MIMLSSLIGFFASNLIYFYLLVSFISLSIIINYYLFLKKVKKNDKNNPFAYTYSMVVTPPFAVGLIVGLMLGYASIAEMKDYNKQTVSNYQQTITEYEKKLKEQAVKISDYEEKEGEFGSFIPMKPDHYAIYNIMKAVSENNNEEIVLALGWSKESKTIKLYRIPLACALEKEYTDNLIVLNHFGDCKWLPPNMKPVPSP